MKRFGFHPDQLYFHMRNPRKVRYLSHPKYGDFEAPKTVNKKDITTQTQEYMHSQYQQRLQFEKYMNPKGLKPTIPPHFPKPQPEIDFVNIDM